ncbi:MAG: AAA family ATPase [Mesorhizobium sp.]|uniref:AAA family ATPase n=1 Tax=Mesorhizobium sp. TaxID=1871066 RepID=UPI001AC1F88B|nr:AAA family ATPase [Mesorhizobium sp.]MBN9219234.1 AAA family ATPase [Mesorhizobium sp.]
MNAHSFRTLLQIEHHVLAGPARRRFVVPGVLPAGVCFLYGASGTGKTGVAVRTAMAVAAGIQWAGRSTAKGSVLYIAGEDFDGVQERLVAAMKALGLAASDVPLGLVEPSAGGLVAPAFEATTLNEADALAATTGQRVSLLVIDTLGACFGDESQDDARPASNVTGKIDRISRRLGCPVLALHHTGKSTSSGMRGSQVFFDRADAVLKAWRHGSSTFIEVEKLKNGPGGARFAFDISAEEIETSAGPISVQVVKDLRSIAPAEAGAEPDFATPTRRKDHDHAFDILKAISVSATVSLLTWKNACFNEWSDRSDTAKRTAFSHAKKRLISAGQISIKRDFVSVIVSEKSAEIPLTKHASQSGLSAKVSGPAPIGGGPTLTTEPLSSMGEKVEVPRKTQRPARTGTGG